MLWLKKLQALLSFKQKAEKQIRHHPLELNLKSGSKKPGSEIVGSVPLSVVDKVAEEKKPDLTANTKEAARRTIEGSIRSMGLTLDY